MSGTPVSPKTGTLPAHILKRAHAFVPSVLTAAAANARSHSATAAQAAAPSPHSLPDGKASYDDLSDEEQEAAYDSAPGATAGTDAHTSRRASASSAASATQHEDKLLEDEDWQFFRKHGDATADYGNALLRELALVDERDDAPDTPRKRRFRTGDSWLDYLLRELCVLEAALMPTPSLDRLKVRPTTDRDHASGWTEELAERQLNVVSMICERVMNLDDKLNGDDETSPRARSPAARPTKPTKQ